MVALLLGAPVPIVWFGAKEAEKRIVSGDVSGAERLLSIVGPLSTYPLLPRLAEARIHGVRSELAASHGMDTEAMEHFVKELEIWIGRDPNAGAIVDPGGKGPDFSHLRFRKGIDDWSRGYREWIQSAPESMPDFDRAFLAPVLEAQANSKTASRSISEGSEPAQSDPAYAETLRALFNRAMRGEDHGEIPAFLERHAGELEVARHWSDDSEGDGSGISQIDETSDHFRHLLLDFLHSCQTHQDAGAVEALGRCGRALRRIESEPSIVSLIVTLALRSQWMDAMESLLDQTQLPAPTREGLVVDLTRYRSDPAFPTLCAHYEYASFRKIYVDHYLGGNWETASPAGRRLFVRQVTSLLSRHEALAAVLSPGTDPEVSRKTFDELHEEGNLSLLVLTMRRRFSNAFYGSDALTEEDGRRFAEGIDEWVVVLQGAIATFRLGRLDDSLQELYESEDRVIGKLKAQP